jgi:hypothetical protein
MVRHVKYVDNGLTFMPAPCTGVFFLCLFVFFYLPSHDMLDSFLSHVQMPCYSCILPSLFVNGAPHALVAKTKRNSITRARGDTFKGPTFLPQV